MIDPANRIGHAGPVTEGSPSRLGGHWQRDWQLISCTLAILLLVLAVEETWDEAWSDDGFYTLGEPFFQFLHIYITGLSLALAFTFWKQDQAIWLVTAALIAILFNPVIPIGFVSWTAYYVLAAGGFAYVALRRPSVVALMSKRTELFSGSISSTALRPEPSRTVAAQSQEVDVRAFRSTDLKTTDLVGSDVRGTEEKIKREPFEGWPQWLRWALFVTVWIAGALLLKPVGELGGAIAGAIGAGGMVFLIGWPLFKLGTLLVPRKKRSLQGDELIRRLEEIAGNSKVSEAHRDEARRRLAEIRTSDR